jgi:hypothetical protein
MEIVEIEEKAEYIKELFEKEKYDSFYLYEARVKTKLDYYVNGRLNREYFDTEAQADLPEYIEWKDIKATVYAYLKGERLPIGFKIILMFNRENISRLLEMNNPFALNMFTSLKSTSGLMLNSFLIIASSFSQFSFCVSTIH